LGHPKDEINCFKFVITPGATKKISESVEKNLPNKFKKPPSYLAQHYQIDACDKNY
jgi:hypothetical protein